MLEQVRRELLEVERVRLRSIYSRIDQRQLCASAEVVVAWLERRLAACMGPNGPGAAALEDARTLHGTSSLVSRLVVEVRTQEMSAVEQLADSRHVGDLGCRALPEEVGQVRRNARPYLGM